MQRHPQRAARRLLQRAGVTGGEHVYAPRAQLHAVRDRRSRELLVARFDLDSTQPEWALAYEWDIVLGRGAPVTTPLESAW